MAFGKLTYRPEIDGLRAIAVLSVMIYHANLGFLSGGFIGVDVFFVLSGFLISSIILEEGARGGFSLLSFYKRRVLRIFPALLAVLAVCLVAGWFWFPPVEYRRLAAAVMGSIGSYSNFHFYKEADYFAPDAITQPLLHTWSLGVEEQFYIVAPFFLLAALRFPRARLAGFLLFFVMSLAYSSISLFYDRPLSFYMLPSRAFELMTGVALALGIVPPLKNLRYAEAASLTGLALILMAAFAYSDGTAFPGLAALVPCLGTALLIHANTSQRTATGRLLSTAPFVFVGKISYSLYLWHWPILAFAIYQFGSAIGPAERIGLLAVATGISVLSYAWLEQPARKIGSRVPPKQVIVLALGAILVCFFVTKTIRRNDGLPGRLPPAAADFVAANPVRLDLGNICVDTVQPVSENTERMDCTIGKPNTPETFLVVGDSHMEAIAGELAAIASANGIAGHLLWNGGCPPLLNLERLSGLFSDTCIKRFARIPEILKTTGIRTVVLHGRWAVYDTGLPTENEPQRDLYPFSNGIAQKHREVFQTMLRQTVDEIKATGRRVVIIASVPEAGLNVPLEMTKALMRGGYKDFPIARAAFDARQKDVMPFFESLDAIDGVEILYPHTVLCDEKRCRTSAAGNALYIDDDHLNPAGAALIAPLLKKALLP
ncbi:acyltransferase family protein [Pararhizobium sp.]|uniref:acyltransferase family protein n=1 Tax=Pararhizobium sp. TaxID=1977563 RepID=UPI003D142F7D